MGGKESTLKDQAWCSNNTYCKSCVTEVENINTEIKRTSPIPKGDLQMMIKEQRGFNNQQSNTLRQNGNVVSSASQNTGTFGAQTSQNTLNTQTNYPSTQQNFSIFASDEKRMEFKSALRQEDRVSKLREVVNIAPKLQLRVLSSAFLEKGEILVINPLGLVNDRSLRQAYDGFTYFGCKKSIKKMPSLKNSAQQMGATGTSQEDLNDEQSNNQKISFEKEIVNDFVIPTQSQEEKDKHRGRQFQIYFDHNSMKYKIKDLGIGYGAFVKLTKPIILRDNFLLNMGESYIVANLIKREDELMMIGGIDIPQGPPMRLRLKIFSVVKADQPDVFSCQNEDQEIVIGRTPNCDIRIEDKLLSKAQATIKYENQNWILQDGFDGRESTNGTWLYLNEDCDIEDGMVFKSNQTFFEALLIYPDQ